MLIAKIYNVSKIEDVSWIRDMEFGVDDINSIPKEELLTHLESEYGPPDLESLDVTEFDLREDDSFLDDRVDMDNDDEGHLIRFGEEDGEEVIYWDYFKIEEREEEEW
jgi:hypothetical protein